MSRLSSSLFGVFVTAAVLTVSAQPAMAAREPARDFVRVGSTDGAGFFRDISIVAESDPLGGSPSGTVSFRVVLLGANLTVSGPVTCLRVDGNHAVIGFDPTQAGAHPVTVVVDNGAVQDQFGAGSVNRADCSTEEGVGELLTLDFGSVLVYDSPSRTQCRHGGWRNYTDDAGRPFRNQGKCIAFVLGAA